jgi:hypothetical protein
VRADTWEFDGLLAQFLRMDASMALRTECEQVLFGVVARLAAKLFVMDFQV